jgi:hypothetical protein
LRPFTATNGGIVQLFKSIDVNGDKTLSPEDFSTLAAGGDDSEFNAEGRFLSLDSHPVCCARPLVYLVGLPLSPNEQISTVVLVFTPLPSLRNRHQNHTDISTPTPNKSNPNRIAGWQKLSVHFDMDGDESISMDEFRFGMKGFGMKVSLESQIKFEARRHAHHVFHLGSTLLLLLFCLCVGV